MLSLEAIFVFDSSFMSFTSVLLPFTIACLSCPPPIASFTDEKGCLG